MHKFSSGPTAEACAGTGYYQYGPWPHPQSVMYQAPSNPFSAYTKVNHNQIRRGAMRGRSEVRLDRGRARAKEPAERGRGRRNYQRGSHRADDGLRQTNPVAKKSSRNRRSRSARRGRNHRRRSSRKSRRSSHRCRSRSQSQDGCELGHLVRDAVEAQLSTLLASVKDMCSNQINKLEADGEQVLKKARTFYSQEIEKHISDTEAALQSVRDELNYTQDKNNVATMTTNYYENDI